MFPASLQSYENTANTLENFLKAIEFPRLLEALAGDCQTPAGRKCLKDLGPSQDAAVIAARLERTKALETALSKWENPLVPDPQYFEEAFGKAREAGEPFSPLELAAFLKFLAQVVGLRQYLSHDKEIPVPFQDWLARLHGLSELKAELSAKVSERGEILDAASPELKGFRDRLRSLRAEVQNFYNTFLQRSESAEALQEKIVTEREGRWVVPVKRDRQSSVPGFVHGMSASGATLFVEPSAIVESNNRVRETLLEEDAEIRRVLRDATRRILEVVRETEETLAACREVDAHCVLGRFASRFDGQFLTPRPGGDLCLRDARHPLLALEAGEAFREKVVPLDLEFKEGTRVILVSGPNAGGKTVALKTLGLACVMAQSGLPTLARPESQFPLLLHFDSDLLDGQSLEDHLSTYAAKLKALKRMMDHCAAGTLFLLDELGAGTDPREGGALGLACLESFREKGAFVMANTHQPLLKLLAQQEKGMANAAMVFDEATGKPTFQLAPGVPGRSYALTLARQFGFDAGILEKAKVHLPPGEADLSEALAKLGAERQALEKARLEAEKSRDQAKKWEAELSIARRQMKDEARKIRQVAQVEADGLLKNTRRQVERLLQGVQASPTGEADKERLKFAQKELGEKLRRIPKASPRLVLEVAELKAGDFVFFKPGQREAKVLEADDEKMTAVIQPGEGLRLSCRYADLGLLPKSSAPSRGAASPKASVSFRGAAGEGMDEKGKMDLDLRGKLVDQALPLLDKFLDDALLAGLPFVRIIHGKGTGALREAVHKHLPLHHTGVEFAMAEPAQGGAGVTVIKFKKD